MAIIIILLIIGFLCLYEFVINPTDDLGHRCKTPYNQSKYTFVTGGEIEILNNSCFVADCCMHTANFRVKMSYEELEIRAKELEIKLEKNIQIKMPK